MDFKTQNPLTNHDNESSALWNALRAGSMDAFEQVYKENAKTLLSYGRKINSDRQVVYDAVHELFNHIWSHRATLNPTASVKNYLLKSLRSRLYKLSQKHNHMNIEYLLYEEEMDYFNSREHEIIHLEQTEVQQKLLKRGIVELSKREQEVLHLKFFENLSLEEIAEILSIKYQSVKNTSFNAISKLRCFFKSQKNDID